LFISNVYTVNIMAIITKRRMKARARTRKAPLHRTTLREIIRNTARDLFAREGYESVSMRRIGAEIGCSPMAMYRYYESKDELLLSICEDTFREMIRLIDRERQKTVVPLERLRRCLKTIIDFHVSHPNHYKVTFMTEVPPGPMAERKMAIGQPTLDRLREGIRECAEARGINADVESFAQLLRAGMHGVASLLILTQATQPVHDPERLKREMILSLTKPLE
jgi:AcrR family transcriptional regulator